MGSLWVTPVLGGLLGLAAGGLAVELETEVPLPPAWQYSPATASTVLATIVGAEVALTGFVITVTVLVVQMAAGMFSARYARLVPRPDAEGAARGARRDDDPRIHAPPARRG